MYAHVAYIIFQNVSTMLLSFARKWNYPCTLFTWLLDTSAHSGEVMWNARVSLVHKWNSPCHTRFTCWHKSTCI